MSKEDCDVLVNILIIGDFGTGKSSLMHRFAEDTYLTSMVSTIDLDFKVKKLEIGNRKIRIHIWDTAGQERFHSLSYKFYRSANGVVLVYDITNEKSFKHVTKWLDCVRRACLPGVPVVLAGNKCDLDAQRQVTTETAVEFAAKHGLEYFLETSAKADVNVTETFLQLISQILQQKPRPLAAIAPSEESIELKREISKICCACCSGS